MNRFFDLDDRQPYSDRKRARASDGPRPISLPLLTRMQQLACQGLGPDEIVETIYREEEIQFSTHEIAEALRDPEDAPKSVPQKRARLGHQEMKARR